jgi:flagellar hook-basal body complex protein FliE
MSGISAIGANPGTVQQIMQMRAELIDRSALLRELHSARPQGVQGLQGAAPGAGPVQPAGTSFAATLESALDGVNATQVRSNAITEAYERGEVTDIAAVMLARQESGVAFEATLQVRNKLLNAYQEIMRMGV